MYQQVNLVILRQDVHFTCTGSIIASATQLLNWVRAQLKNSTWLMLSSFLSKSSLASPALSLHVAKERAAPDKSCKIKTTEEYGFSYGLVICVASVTKMKLATLRVFLYLLGGVVLITLVNRLFMIHTRILPEGFEGFQATENSKTILSVMLNILSSILY